MEYTEQRNAVALDITFGSWLNELRVILASSTYALTPHQIETYTHPSNWTEYFTAGYSPAEAAAEDSEFWDAA